MKENKYKLKAQIVAVEGENCDGCIFKNQNCVELKKAKLIPLCMAENRKDGKSVIFIIKSFNKI